MPAHSAEQIDVKIYIKTIIKQGNDTETHELTTVGRYQQTKQAAYLRYEEAMEVGNVSTTVKITQSEALILRNGAIKMRMVFRPGQSVSGTYHTPMGVLETIITAKTTDHTYNGQTKQGTINILYDLTMQGSLAGTYDLYINFEEERK